MYRIGRSQDDLNAAFGLSTMDTEALLDCMSPQLSQPSKGIVVQYAFIALWQRIGPFARSRRCGRLVPWSDLQPAFQALPASVNCDKCCAAARHPHLIAQDQVSLGTKLIGVELVFPTLT